jgi:DNA-binding MarR family transcriptional regulator
MNIAQLIVALKKFPMDMEVKMPQRRVLGIFGQAEYITIDAVELIKKYEYDPPNTKPYVALKSTP